MRLTVTTLSDEIFTFEVSEDMELDSFRALCEIETGISAREIVVFWNGRPLHDNRRKLRISPPPLTVEICQNNDVLQ